MNTNHKLKKHIIISKTILTVLFITLLFSLSCVKISVPEPDLTPPTALSMEETALDEVHDTVNPYLTLSWYLIRDDDSSIYDGVNIYYVENGSLMDDGTVVSDDATAYEFFIEKWSQHRTIIDKREEIRNCCIIKNSYDTVPSVTSNYYTGSNTDPREYTISPSEIKGENETSYVVGEKYYFIMSSAGTWEEQYIESPLSNMVSYEIIDNS